ncbi:MAG: hypothetical protein ACLQJR_28760 [Stellaceae bacterium]
MAGWVRAMRILLEAQRHALRMMLPRQPQLEIAPPASAGNKPALAPRRRPPKRAAASAPRRRGRPPKASRAPS